MEQKLLSQENKIYDSYDKLVENSKKNYIIRIYKLVLLCLIGISTLFILIFSNQTLLDEKIWKSLHRTLTNFLSFEDPTSEQTNTLIIFKTTLLLFVIYYSLVKNFLNLYFQKELIKKYYIWFSLYLSISLTAFVLLFTFNSSVPIQQFNLLFILIPLFLINIAYRIYLHIFKSKSDPINYGKKIPMIISLASQGLIVITLLAIFLTWNAKANIKNVLFYQNKFNDFIKKLFTNKSAVNLTIIITFTIYGTLLVLGANLEKITFIANGSYTREYFKYNFQVVAAILIASLLWFISGFTIKIPDENYLGVNSKISYYFLFEILFALLVLTSYCLLTFKTKFKIRGSLLNSLYFSSHLMIMWLSLLITSLYKQNVYINLANVFAVSLISLAMLIIYLQKIKIENVLPMMLVIAFVVTNILILVMAVINQVLLKNKNFAFLTISSNLSLLQILLITHSLLITILFATNFIQLNITLFKINNLKTNIWGEQNV